MQLGAIALHFGTIGDIPIAMVDRKKFTPLRNDYKLEELTVCNPKAIFLKKSRYCLLLSNMQPDMIDLMIDNGYKGIIFAGTGWDMSLINRYIRFENVPEDKNVGII